MAGKIDIGSMGDYPLLINGSRAGTADARTEFIAVTGYNPRGALNSVVVAGLAVPDARATSRARRCRPASARPATACWSGRWQGRASTRPRRQDREPAPAGRRVRAAGRHGRRVVAVRRLAGAAGLPGRRPAALRRRRVGVPTLHGVVARKSSPTEHPEVVEAFLEAQHRRHELPARPTAGGRRDRGEATGLPAEVVYLYNGANGIATFDPTHQAAAARGAGAGRPVPEVDRRARRTARPRRVRQRQLHQEVYGAGYDRRRPSRPTRPRSPAPTRLRPAGQRPGRGQRGLAGRRGRHPARRRPDLPAAHVARSRPTGRSCGPRTCRTPSPAPAGSPTSVSGCGTAHSFMPFATAAAADAYVAAHPGARSSAVARRGGGAG